MNFVTESTSGPKRGAWQSRCAKLTLASFVAAVLLAIPASAGAVTVVLGPPDASAEDPFAQCDALAPEFCSAKTFIPTALPQAEAMLSAPADGTIVSWRVRGAPPAKLRLRVVQPLGGGQFKAIATSGVAKVSDGKSDNIAAISIAAGNQLGIDVRNEPLSASPSTLLGHSTVPGAAWSSFSSGLADGAIGAPDGSASGSMPSFNATVVLHKPLLLALSSTGGPETGGELVAITGIHLAIATRVTFGDVPAQIVSAGSNQIMVVAPPHPPGTVDVAVHTAAGASDPSAAARYTFTQVPPPAPDTAGPRLRAFGVAPVNFRAKAGTTISFRSNEPGRVRFTFQRKLRRGPFAKVRGTFVRKVKVGLNRFRMPRRISKRLKVGRYRLVAVVTDQFGNRSRPPLRRAFRVIP